MLSLQKTQHEQFLWQARFSNLNGINESMFNYRCVIVYIFERLRIEISEPDGPGNVHVSASRERGTAVYTARRVTSFLSGTRLPVQLFILLLLMATVI